jgi:hypothetical protein
VGFWLTSQFPDGENTLFFKKPLKSHHGPALATAVCQFFIDTWYKKAENNRVSQTTLGKL